VSLTKVLASSGLSTLDLSGNSICRMSEDDHEVNLAPILEAIVTIRHLNASSCLTELNLSFNKLEELVVHGLAEALKNPLLSLQKLLLDGCGISNLSAAPFAEALPLVKCLKVFSLSRNRLGISGLQVPRFSIRAW
jgi:Leucine-rich repeat (LRR) protein